jgi:hypothetical protein
MKFRFKTYGRLFSVVAVILFLLQMHVYCQTITDSVYLPPIKLTSLNGYGPYMLGSERSNLFIIYELPKNTSKIIMKMIDTKGEQIGSSYTLTGSSLQTAEWSFESDTMGFPLSPQFVAEIHYQSDSIAVYKIPYTVYPDTAIFTGSKGFGPFVTNNYTFSDTSFHPVPANANTFTFKQVPPRTDTIVFQILSNDSVVLQSKTVIAAPGTYLDSAMYENVRMDVLPLNTAILRTIVFCEGGPKGGLQFHKALSIVPHNPKLICTSDSLYLHDSVGVFIQNQISGQALAVDSMKHALIQNGPGSRDLDNHLRTIYPGPYSIDYMQSSFSIEAWVNFNFAGMTGIVKSMDLMTVDSVWQLYAEANIDGVAFFFATSAGTLSNDLWSVSLDPGMAPGSGWHHIAFTCSYNNAGGYPAGRFYLDGVRLPGVSFDASSYEYILTYIDWRQHAGTQPLRLGGNDPTSYSIVRAMDEVRILSRTLSQEEINYHFHKPPLQEDCLEGYWNFDDLRNRLKYITDKSYNNNSGTLKNNAAFIPQYPGIQRTIDTLKVLSSALRSDSVKYIFTDRSNIRIDSCTRISAPGGTSWIYNMSSLPYSISKLKVFDYLKPLTDNVPEVEYNLSSLAPEPIVTPQYNWGCYYTTPPSTGKTFAPVTVSGFPNDTRRVILGLRNGNQEYDTMNFTGTSIPYHHSLTLNGSDNWIQTSQKISSPNCFSILFWVKTTSKEGGKILGFSDQQNGTSTTYHDREIIMGQNGSLQVNLLSGSAPQTLNAMSKNNDGEWHHVALTVDNSLVASLYVDGSLSDDVTLSGLQTYQGWWTIGTSGAAKKQPAGSVAPFFHGSLTEISIWNRALTSEEIDSLRFETGTNPGQVLCYNMDDGTGTLVTDHAGLNNGMVKGSNPDWSLSKRDISFVTWFTNITKLQPGTYTFFANVYYPFCPPSGAYYPLGNFMVSDPFPGYKFNFFLTKGQGYFNQGISLINTLMVSSDYTGAGQPGWTGNYIKYNFLTPDHETISSSTMNYTTPSFSGEFSIDMGDATPGSYISLETGYVKGGIEISQNAVSLPISIYPMIPPKIVGNFGPFDQAIAPGTMQYPNTFLIETGPLTDIDSIRALFYDVSDSLTGASAAVKVSDSSWSVTYDMSVLTPPVSIMKLNYYLGQDITPVAEGPYRITIRKTRPIWFDFLPPSDFSNIQQSGNIVTFQVSTPFDKTCLVNNSIGVTIPDYVPMIGGIKSTLFSPTANAYLKYDIGARALSLNQPPDFYHEMIRLGIGSPSTLHFGFNSSQNNSYKLDKDHNLIATQNFSVTGSLSSEIMEIENIAEGIGNLLNIAEAVDVSSVIVKPSFKLSGSLAFKYASRLHLEVDTATGKWGSFGELDVDADPGHNQEFRNSASFHFYSGSLGLEFALGAEFLEGLVSGYFAVDGRVAMGYGHSYITIPNQATRPLESAVFQVYGKFYVDVLWGWYEKTLWGPKLFYSDNFWGDDMSKCFPPVDKDAESDKPVVAKSTWPSLAGEIVPVSEFTKMPKPVPWQSTGSSAENRVFTWTETGHKYGERTLKFAYMLMNRKKFSDYISIELNNHALNSPVTDAVTDNEVLLSWAQSRYTDKSVDKVRADQVLTSFLQAQDIWYGVYDISGKSVKQVSIIHDDTLTLTSGRVEGNPKIVNLSNDKALIVWQVANIENKISTIWYVTLTKQNDQWVSGNPAVLSNIAGVKTQVTVAAYDPGKAVVVWMNTTGAEHRDKKLMTVEYDGTGWSTPAELLPLPENQSCNYFDMKIENGVGGVVMTVFNDLHGDASHEKLIFLPFDAIAKRMNPAQATELYTEHVSHLQLPQIAIHAEGKATIAVKVERIGKKSASEKICQVDLFQGNLNSLPGAWSHIKGNEYVCDTTKQVREIALSCISHDTLMILSYEYPMLATNSVFTPLHGVTFGNPAMNLVLRCFAIEKDSVVVDVPEQQYFTGINDDPTAEHPQRLLQCYPNPCDVFTNLAFTVQEHSKVRIEVKDISGHPVAVLVDQNLPKGNYETKMNTALLSPGIYLCLFTNGTFSDQVKIVVTR